MKIAINHGIDFYTHSEPYKSVYRVSNVVVQFNFNSFWKCENVVPSMLAKKLAILFGFF